MTRVVKSLKCLLYKWPPFLLGGQPLTSLLKGLDQMVKSAVIYVPSDTPEAMTLATKRVAGVPMIVRGIMTCAMAGIENCAVLLAPPQRKKVEDFLKRYPEHQLCKVEFIEYDEPYRVSPATVSNVLSSIKSDFILANADLLFEKDLIELANTAKPSDDEIAIFRDGAHPLPIFVVKRSQFEKMDAFTTEKPRSIESCIKQLIASAKPVTIQKPKSSNTFLLGNNRDRVVAEKSLTEAIRHRVGGPVAKYLNKRISLPISLILSKLWVSPNTITAVNIIIGVFSGVFVADGKRYWSILLGAALFQTASIVDGCDGEVAKLTFRQSKFGQYADTLCDNLSLTSFIVGLIAGYWRHTHSPMTYVLGTTLAVCTIITFAWMIIFLKKHTQSASLVTYDTEFLQKLDRGPKWLLFVIKYGKYTLKKDFFSFAFLCFAAAGVLYSWLYIAAIGTFASASILTYLNLRDRFATKRSAKLLETGGRA